eukprot:SAG31_NODE_34_length_31842_cov_31.677850_2_plen_114_part_00
MAGTCDSRAYHTATIGPTSRLFVYGGLHEGEASGSLQTLQIDTDDPTWETPTTDGVAPQDRFGHSCCWQHGTEQLVYVGGSNGSDLLRDGEDFVGSVFVLQVNPFCSILGGKT